MMIEARSVSRGPLCSLFRVRRKGGQLLDVRLLMLNHDGRSQILRNAFESIQRRKRLRSIHVEDRHAVRTKGNGLRAVTKRNRESSCRTRAF